MPGTLTDDQKALLRWLVQEVRDGSLGEEFFVVWGQNGGHVRGQSTPPPLEITKGKLDALASAGMLTCTPKITTTTKLAGSKTRPHQRQTQSENSRVCTLMPAAYEAVDSDFRRQPDIREYVTNASSVAAPPEIQQSLERFRSDHPDGSKVAFVMMRFAPTPAHTKIVAAITQALAPHGITALRADSKEYHDDLYWNILTYIYGCSFGIAVFERIEADDFNPNVAFEVGYMLALGKPVCLLKDRTLKTLQSDLVGKLYRGFDPQQSRAQIAKPIIAWLSDKGLSAAAVQEAELPQHEGQPEQSKPQHTGHI